jgi:hypothetical protein
MCLKVILEVNSRAFSREELSDALKIKLVPMSVVLQQMML